MPLELRPLNDHQVELYDETGYVGYLVWVTRDHDDPHGRFTAYDSWHGLLQIPGQLQTPFTTGHATAAEALQALLPAYDNVVEKRAYQAQYENAGRWKSIVSVPSGGQPRRR